MLAIYFMSERRYHASERARAIAAGEARPVVAGGSE
jgi:hypothetical protein